MSCGNNHGLMAFSFPICMPCFSLLLHWLVHLIQPVYTHTHTNMYLPFKFHFTGIGTAPFFGVISLPLIRVFVCLLTFYFQSTAPSSIWIQSLRNTWMCHYQVIIQAQLFSNSLIHKRCFKKSFCKVKFLLHYLL